MDRWLRPQPHRAREACGGDRGRRRARSSPGTCRRPPRRSRRWCSPRLDANQFDALCDFAFNIGEPAFRTCDAARHLNEGRPLRAAAVIEMWRRVTIGDDSLVVDAVVRRRAAEKALFLTPVDGFPPAPTPVLRPELDRRMTYDTDRLAASEESPVAAVAPLEGDDCRPGGGCAPAHGGGRRRRRAERAPVPHRDRAVSGSPPLPRESPSRRPWPIRWKAAPSPPRPSLPGAAPAVEGPPAHDARGAFPPATARGASPRRRVLARARRRPARCGARSG